MQEDVEAVLAVVEVELAAVLKVLAAMGAA